MPTLRVTLIICTRSRRSALETCLRSVERAAEASPEVACEVLVVDNGSSDETPAFLTRYRNQTTLDLRLLSKPQKGLAGARNLALRHAKGEILAFTDDDCELDRHYLADLARRYEKPEPPTIRGGRVELADSADAPMTIKLSDAVERLSPELAPGGFVHGCNLTMHREVAQAVGDFDERFGAGSALQAAEDTDYLVRAYLVGIPVEYVPDMIVFHKHGRRTPEAIRSTLRNYSFANGALYMKHRRAAPWLFKHLFWTARSAVAEARGGPLFDADLGASHWPVVAANIAGLCSYALLSLRGRLTSRAS